MINLADYGYTNFFQGPENEENVMPARVLEVHRERYIVLTKHGECGARLKGSVYYQAETDEQYPTVGDFVRLAYNANGDSVIHQTLRRKSCFERSDTFSARGVQAVAANFDYVFIMTSLNHDFNLKRIQRYLTATWQSNGLPVIVLTKADLVEDYETPCRAVETIAVGVEVIAVSTETGFGLGRLSSYLKLGKTIVFLGSSGVGKSSLVNALAKERIMAVKDIRADDSKGKHTTTHRQLLRLSSGVLIIDTPGMRELGMWDVRLGLGETFSSVEELVTQCKFSNCTHKNEPNCAIQAAIADGILDSAQWAHYVQLKKEAKFTADKSSYLQEKKQWHREIAKLVKSKKKDQL